MIDGQPHEVSEEKEKSFLETNKDSNPVLSHVKAGNTYVNMETGVLETPDWSDQVTIGPMPEEHYSGNQQSSTEGATVEQNTTAQNQNESSVSNLEDGSSVLQNNQQANFTGPLQEDGTQGEGHRSTSELALEEDISNARATVSQDSDGDGITDVNENSINRVNDYYKDTLYNETEAPGLQEQYDQAYDQQMQDFLWGEQRKSTVSKIGYDKFDSMSVGSKAGVPKKKTAARDIQTDVDQIYNKTIQDVAVQDYIKNLTSEFLPDGKTKNPNYDPNFDISDLSPEDKRKFINSIIEQDDNGEFINQKFPEFLNKAKEEATDVRNRRVELNQKLEKGEINQEQYDEELKLLNGYTDDEGNVINPEDRFHANFENSLFHADKQSELRKQLNIELEEGKETHRQKKKHKKEQLETAEKLLTDKQREIQMNIDSQAQLNEKQEKLLSSVKTDHAWLISEKEGEGVWTRNRLEELQNTKIEGDPAILDKIKTLSETPVEGDQAILSQIEKIANGTYTTQEQVDAAKAKIEALQEEYRVSAEANLKNVNDQITALAQEYDSQVKEKAAIAQKEYTDLYNNYTGKQKNINDAQKQAQEWDALSATLNDEFKALDLDIQDLSVYAQQSRKYRKTFGASAMASTISGFAKNFGDFGEMLFDVKDNFLDKHIKDPNIRKAVDVMTYMLPGGLQIAMGDLMFNTKDKEEGALFDLRDKDGKAQSLWDIAGGAWEETQYKYLDQYHEDPVDFDDVYKSWEDGEPNWANTMEWGLTTAITQIPVVATLAATSAMGCPMCGLGVLSANSMGNKYNQLQEEVELSKKTGGVYGNRYSFGQMVLNSTIHGGVEGALEYFTAGIIGKTMGSFLKQPMKESAKLGFNSFTRKAIFTPKNAAYAFGESLEETFAEGGTAVGQNLADIFILGKKDVGVWDNVLESSISGFGMGTMFQSPRLLAHARRPFSTSDSNQQIGEMANKMSEISDEITRLRNTNNPENLKKIERLEQQYVELTNRTAQIMEYDIKRVDALSNEQKAELVEMERRTLQDRVEAEKIRSDDSLTKEERAEKLDNLKKNVDARNAKKEEILNSIEPKVVHDNYDRINTFIQKNVDLANKMGPVKTTFRRVNAKEFEKRSIKGEGLDSKAELENIVSKSKGISDAMDEIINDPNSSPEEIADAKRIKKENSVADNIRIGEDMLMSKNNFGTMIPQIKDGKLVGMEILINEDTALENGEFTVGAHEFVHAAFRNTLGGDPVARVAMGKQIDKIINDKDVEFASKTARKKYNERLKLYDGNIQGEEKLAFLSEMVLNEDVKFKNDGPINKIKGLLRRFSQNVLGFPIKFDNKNDVVNFLKDYKKAYDTNSASPAIAKMLQKGANGEIFNDPRSLKQRNAEQAFSRAVDLNRQQNPDLKREFDQFILNSDGKPKYKSHQEFKDSPDYSGALLTLLEGRAHDGLIMQGMTDAGVQPDQMREFVQNVKQELARRFQGGLNKDSSDKIEQIEEQIKKKEISIKEGVRQIEAIKNNRDNYLAEFNYDIVKDDKVSLFGWLTGSYKAIHWAKEDVKKAWVRSRPGFGGPSLDQQISTEEGSATLKDRVGGVQDATIESIDEMDLSFGRKSALKEIVREGTVKDVLGFDGDTRSAIESSINDADVSIKDMKYKDVKRLLDDVTMLTKVDKKTGKPQVHKTGKRKGQVKLFRPTSSMKTTPEGAAFGVLNAVSAEFGIDPLRILANQDLDGQQRTDAQNYIFEKSVNDDGSFNKTLLDILPEGEDRSGWATGVANTDLGDFYTKGERVRVGEGAAKEGGQKAEQIKRKRITKQEFLNKFGINQDGTFKKGTSADGAIRQLVLQVAQTAANQQLREKALSRGELKEAIVAKLGDGKSEQMWSKAPVVNREAAIEDVADNVNQNTQKGEVEGIVNGVVDAWTEKGVSKKNKEVNDLKKFLLDTIDKFIFRKKILKSNYNVTLKEDVKNRDAQLTDEAADKSLKEKLNLDTPPGNEFLSVEGVKSIRNEVSNGFAQMGKDMGIVDATRMYLTHGVNAFTGSGKTGDGRIINDKNGDPIVDPNWEDRGDIPGNKWKRWDSKSISKAPKGTKVGDLKLNSKGQRILKDNRYKPFATIEDYIKHLNKVAGSFGINNQELIRKSKEKGFTYEVWDGKKYIPVKTNMLKESNSEALKDVGNKERQKQRARESAEAREFSKWHIERAFNNPNVSDSSLGAIMMNLGSGMNSPMRKAAQLTMVVKNAEQIIDWHKKNIAKIRKLFGSSVPALRYEHSESKAVINNRILESLMQTSKDGGPGFIADNVWEGYEVFVIPGVWDHAQNLANFKTKSAKEGELRATSMETIAELINMVQQLGPQSAVNISGFNSVEVQTNVAKEKKIQSAVDVAAKILKLKPVSQVSQDVAIETGRLVRQLNSKLASDSKSMDKSEGMSVFDFDETLIIDGKNVVVATNPKTKETEVISSEDWPTRGTELMELGWSMNFDDFINVRGGVKGPLFKKLLNRIKKYGPDNNFILTARPQESAVAIHGWLKSKGVNIPLNNITGLGNSTGDAKAQWILNKYKEGYNDVYFVDDAMQNVDAVKHVMDQLDIKGSSVQAKVDFNKNVDAEFNQILADTSKMDPLKRVTAQEAAMLGKKKGGSLLKNFFIPPSAEDFKGLLYRFLAKGKKGDQHMEFFKKNLLDPYSKAYTNWNSYKQNMSNEYSTLKKSFPNVVKSMKDIVPGTNLTNDHAIRAYLWNKGGLEVPGLSDAQKQVLVDHVSNNPELSGFADNLSKITRLEEGYIRPDENWTVKNIARDLNDIVKNVGRKQFFEEWKNNKDQIFSKENLNKIEAIHGTNFRQELEKMLYRMETGSNRVTGKNRHVNRFMDWINGSVGAVMFFNMRSASLQTISMANFINWKDNNIFAASKAFANQPQFWKDFAMIFNSPMLKQRRAGMQIDVNANELMEAFSEGKSKPEAVIKWMLEKGFLPTQMADSFAIAMGGAPFYRNRLDKYIKEGKHPEQAAQDAWSDFQEIAEETQQSSRPDLISNQQAGPLGRLILAWQNTPMQMTRLTKKAISDLVNGRGDPKQHISRIMYYGLIQNLIFGTLQTGLGFLLFGDDEEDEKRKKMSTERVLNGALDTLLRGTGVYGAAISTVKNTIMEFYEQRRKGWGADHGYTVIEAINLSPPIGSKLRKVYKAIQADKWNRGVGKKLGFRVESPGAVIAANIIEALTNAPVARLLNKANHIEEALTGNHEMWQRMALLGGWDMWSVGVKDEEVEQAKADIKREKKEQKELEKIQKKKEKEEQKKIEEQKEKERKEKEGIKTVRCSGTNSSGRRCGLTTETKKKTWKCPHHAEFKDGSDTDGDGIKEYRCTAVKSNGKRCKNKTENKNKKCYAHQ